MHDYRARTTKQKYIKKWCYLTNASGWDSGNTSSRHPDQTSNKFGEEQMVRPEVPVPRISCSKSKGIIITIVNLTQHPVAREQAMQGVIALPAEAKKELKELLTFDSLPSPDEVTARAAAIAEFAAGTGAGAAMIGGAPYLMAPLERALQERGIAPLYAFSERKSVETTDPATGEVTKTSVFVHLGFVEA